MTERESTADFSKRANARVRKLRRTGRGWDADTAGVLFEALERLERATRDEEITDALCEQGARKIDELIAERDRLRADVERLEGVLQQMRTFNPGAFLPPVGITQP